MTPRKKVDKESDLVRELDILVKRREDIFALVNVIFQASKKVTSTSSKALQAQLKHLEKLEKDFEEIQTDIINFNAQLENPAHAVETTKVAISFFELIWAIRANVPNVDTPSRVEVSGTSSLPPLQPMQIPIFDGSLKDWTEFKSLFDQLIHYNSNLSAVQKFFYLKTYVKGDAAKIISNLDITEINYPIAYSALQKRYASKRRLANKYLSEILNFRYNRNVGGGKISDFLSVHENAIASLKAMHLPDLADYVLFRITYENLSPHMKYLFDDKCDSQNIPSCRELFDFLLHHAQNFELRSDNQNHNRFIENKPKPDITKKSTSPKTFFTNQNLSSDQVSTFSDKSKKVAIICPLCKGCHLIYSCPDFLKLNISDRRATINRLERCTNCLGQHNFQRCQSKKKCSKCGLSHHSFLHEEATNSSNTKVSSNFDSPPRCNFVTKNSSMVILGTFLAQIQDSRGNYHQIRCLMDPCSHISAISKSLVKNLNLKTKKATCLVSSLENSSSCSTEMLNISIRSCLNSQNSVNFPAYVFNEICDKLPSEKIVTQSSLEHLKDLDLADPFFYQPGPVDLLLSAEMSSLILSQEQPNLIVGQPTAIRSLFGWIIYGAIPVIPKDTNTNAQSFLTLQENLQKFWEVEDIPLKSFKSPDEEWCEAHFLKTFSRDHSGRYIVALPFRPDAPPLGNNRKQALKRWVNLEKRLIASDNKADYDEVLREYLSKDHMELATSPSNYILPHHAVFKASSTTKIRVVFDASVRDEEGLSLNDRLFTGPKLQRDISGIINSFRFFRFALCGDISQMYRMILLQPSDRYCQHIFWRNSISQSVEEYELKTLTFGFAPSPFLAQRVLQQLVHDEGKEYNLASRALTEHTYVDDIITGSQTLEGGKRLQKELIGLLEKGGFYPRKWCSNHPELLLDVPKTDLETPFELSDGTKGLKLLGLYWNHQLDSFTYQVKTFESKLITKRTILSFIAKIFDPMGWLAPVTILAKIFLQRLWLEKLNWDEELGKTLGDQWLAYSKGFNILSTIKIPRFVNFELEKTSFAPAHRYKLIGFCDASEKAYAACVYVKNLDSKGSVILLQAKTKVAPLKTLTVACLELCGALLLIRLIKSMTFPFAIEEIQYFTDSKIVLTWLHTPLYKLKIFVANRVAQILENSKVSQWSHISGTLNPADLASRGIFPEDIINCPLWWNGPSEFTSEEDCVILSELDTPELKKCKTFMIKKTTQNFIDMSERISSWIRLQRVMTWIFRFIHNCRFKNDQNKNAWIAVEEYDAVIKKIILLNQMHYYSTERIQIQNDNTPPSLASLQPFLDNSGCIRVGGRLRHSNLGFNTKHPFLIPPTSHLASLLIRHYHLTSLHSGPSTVQALIQQNFWIPSLRNLIRKYTHRCASCCRWRASTLQPKMADLPPERVTVSQPFSRSATDFAGPFNIKESSRRTARLSKAYLCIFICLVTKAVHLELVTSLTTEAFLASFTRFVSRRGLPAMILSDNGRNFLGASRDIKSFQNWLKEHEAEISSSLATKSIVWKFNPPEAPHFGGLFEAGIKSAKFLLHRLMGNQAFTYEELATLFSKVEAVLNSRPLTPISTDPHEDYLAPSHFLIGGMLNAIPEQPLPETSLLTRWKRVQQLTQAFWKRWSKQYLHTLIQRNKWKKDNPSIAKNDIVIIKGQQSSPLSWPLGRIIETFPGKDGLVRVVSVRTASGTYIRPTNKLILIPSTKE